MTASTAGDRFAAARAVADAVLYEGYVLYPYRASAQKNQLRWQLGVLVPPAQAAVDDSERCAARAECVVVPGTEPRLHVRVRCLQVQHRSIEAVAGGGGTSFEPVDRLDVDGARWVAWDEAVDHEVDLEPLDLVRLAEAPHVAPLHLPAADEVEELHDATGVLRGRAVRNREPVHGRVGVGARWADTPRAPGSPLVVSVTVENATGWSRPGARRDDVVARSLVAVHVLLAVDGGEILSLLDPPPGAEGAVAGCRNEGLFPVLIGRDGDLVLASPIILYDRPEVAPESVGDHFDATEIDEMLSLRVLTLTDAEKAEVRGTDRRAAEIVDRCDAMHPEVWARLHGAVRSLDPVGQDPPGGEVAPWWDPDVDAATDPWTESVEVGGTILTAGSRVVLRPGHRRADAHDLFLAGMAATVAGVFTDAEGRRHVAVSVDDDPATEALAWQGRYLFFHPDELEPVAADGVEQP